MQKGEADDEIITIIKEMEDCRPSADGGLVYYSGYKQRLAEKINFLITSNFSMLVALLYRLDISEKKLRKVLAEAGDTPAGSIIAQLILEREKQKMEWRKKFKPTNDNIPEEDKW